ncbi:hypothetical protein JOB18_047860 [Solea senegalensis]|uniref:Uncharacterized protein n=1 Tax=Solea senegalensis TaxID=28829 RepID=A0AAV6QLN9_SOLSE|nr:hypothetical protein JOB18_047860 [Solea senegalensis]
MMTVYPSSASSMMPRHKAQVIASTSLDPAGCGCGADTSSSIITGPLNPLGVLYCLQAFHLHRLLFPHPTPTLLPDNLCASLGKINIL